MFGNSRAGVLAPLQGLFYNSLQQQSRNRKIQAQCEEKKSIPAADSRPDLVDSEGFIKRQKPFKVYLWGGVDALPGFDNTQKPSYHLDLMRREKTLLKKLWEAENGPGSDLPKEIVVFLAEKYQTSRKEALWCDDEFEMKLIRNPRGGGDGIFLKRMNLEGIPSLQQWGAQEVERR